MSRRIAVLGSTGSVGRQTLDVLRDHPEEEIYALTAGRNIDLLRQQILACAPQRVVLLDASGAYSLSKEFPHIQVDCGPDALVELGRDPQVDFLISAVVGIDGLAPLVAAVQNGKTIALANKEPLVAAGELLMSMANSYGATVLPVDSEHSAIFQCLSGVDHPRSTVQEIIITASGGPFYGRSEDELALVTPEEAVKHPRWNMGAKISVDSATMMNKALEIIEARWLFGVRPDQIRVTIHPESIVHSMVSFVDGSVLAHLAVPDMRLPIAYALSWPNRWENSWPALDWAQSMTLHFNPPEDPVRFRALDLARHAMEIGRTMPAVMNAANECAVRAFLSRILPFTSIVPCVEEIMQRHEAVELKDVGQISEIAAWTANEFAALTT